MDISAVGVGAFIVSIMIHHNRRAILGMLSLGNIRSLSRLSPHGTSAPPTIHKTLTEKDLKDNVIIVGDIHGCLDEFVALLEKCNYSKATSTVILVGDLVNKGPKSAEVIKHARHLNCHCVRGNHDDAALEVLQKNSNDWPKSYKYLSFLSASDIDWLQALPYTISLPSMNCIVVHAGLLPGKAMEEQTFDNMYRMRNITHAVLSNGTTELIASEKGEGTPWAQMWKTGPHVYFGHDAKRGLQLCENATGLDTGCCYGRELSAMVLPGRELVQVKALTIYQHTK